MLALDKSTGTELWPYSFKSSMVGANGKLYLTAEDDDVMNTLSYQFILATPAIAGGEIFLRGQSTLFCISEKH